MYTGLHVCSFLIYFASKSVGNYPVNLWLFLCPSLILIDNHILLKTYIVLFCSLLFSIFFTLFPWLCCHLLTAYCVHSVHMRVLFMSSKTSHFNCQHKNNINHKRISIQLLTQHYICQIIVKIQNVKLLHINYFIFTCYTLLGNGH